ncbi:MAG: hypothetical protein MUP27_09415 [Desulfobacterales bacterium]|nr:hypothetical protein [Desulfobacterales bacterium]
MAKELVGWVKHNGIYQRSLISLDTDLFTKVWVEVFNSLGSTFNRGDFTATNAFFWSSLDLSAFAGTDLGSTPFYIEVLDGAGKKATGYIGAVGAGETLGDEILTNPSFDVDTSGWSTQDCTSASIAGGQSGKCLEITMTGGSAQNVFQAPIIRVTSGLYKLSIYEKSGTSGADAARLVVYSDSWVTEKDVSALTTGSWVQLLGYAGALDTSGRFYVIKNSAVAGTMLFDEASFKHVTDPPSTAVHIVSSLNGTTRDWASIESGFNPNGIVSWKIYG